MTKQTIPWRERPLLNLQDASKLLGVSTASIYRFEREGRLVFTRLAGRTLIETPSLIALVDSTEAWSPSGRPEKANRRRKVIAQSAQSAQSA